MVHYKWKNKSMTYAHKNVIFFYHNKIILSCVQKVKAKYPDGRPAGDFELDLQAFHVITEESLYSGSINLDENGESIFKIPQFPSGVDSVTLVVRV